MTRQFFLRGLLAGAAIVTVAAWMFPVDAQAEGGYLVFVVDTPLVQDDKTARWTYFVIYVDGRKVHCEEEDVNPEDGWLCKLEPVPSGSHNLDIQFHTRYRGGGIADASYNEVRAAVTLREEDKKFEYPGEPSHGDEFWCVLIGNQQLAQLPASDERCHSD